MLPPVSPIRASMSGGPEHLVVDQAVLRSPGAKRAIRSMNCLATLVAARVPVAVADLVGRVLAEDAQQVLALGRRASGRSRSGCRSRRSRPRARRRRSASNARWASSIGRSHVDRRPGGPVLARRGGPGRQPVERGVELDHRAADLPVLEPLAVGRVDVGAVEHAEQPLRIGVADHGAGAQPGAVLELDALSREDRGDRDAAGEHRAGLAGGVGDREAHHPHAALDVAPDRPLAVEVALVVHQLDRGGAGLARPAPGADDRPGRRAPS